MAVQVGLPIDKLPTERAPGITGPGLSLGALTGLVVGSMIGGGIFALPSQMASSAAPGPLMIGWVITGVGMLTLALVFQRLATARPDVQGGVYGYAREAFGDYLGFTSAWGYWISAWIGNVGYFVLLFSTLGYFFPAFKGGNTLPAIIGASVVLWLVHALVLRGVHGASSINTIVTAAKVIPIVVFVGIALVSFKAGIFTADFWGRVTQIAGDNGPVTLGSTLDQVKNMMLVTVWVFIGVEGASIYSERAARRQDVGKATVFGFLGVLALLLLVNLLAYGAMPQADIAALDDPSMGGVLAHIVGPWGATFVGLGLIVSLLGALLAWVLLCAEILRVPAADGNLPRALGALNAKGSPSAALWLTNLCVQAMLIWTYFNDSTYTSLIYLASSLILLPYLWSACYQLFLAARGQADLHAKDLIVALVATGYAVWLVYAGGLSYVLVAAVAYLVGTALFAWARVQASKRVFVARDYAFLALVVIGAVLGVVGLINGSITV